MNKIQVKDVDTFLLLLSSLLRIIPSCKFIVNDKGIKVRIITESKGMRGFFVSDCAISEQPTEFCFGDLSKFFKSATLIKTIEDNNQCEFKFDGTFLSYDNQVKFKLKTIKEDRIARFISPTDITTTFDSQYSFKTSDATIKKVLQCVNIVDDSESKVYFSKNKHGLVCEVDNKLNKMSDSIGLPICTTKSIKGDVNSVVQTTLDNFRSFGILPSKSVNINITKQKIIIVDSACKLPEKQCKIAMQLYCSILKG